MYNIERINFYEGVYMNEKYYGYYKSPIGILEIISSDQAILSVLFVDKIKTVIEATEIIKEAIRQLDEYFKGTRIDFNLEIELNGTEFQKKVWNGLLNIPYGKTVSYKELASEIGNVNASRAVGNANSKNLINIIVPCHRVIGSNNNLIGYAGGLNRKLWLIEHEKRNCK